MFSDSRFNLTGPPVVDFLSAGNPGIFTGTVLKDFFVILKILSFNARVIMPEDSNHTVIFLNRIDKMFRTFPGFLNAKAHVIPQK